MSNFSPDQERQIREFINSDQLIPAIKLYREITGVGLLEAKSAVEALARGENVNIPTSSPQSQLNDPLLESKIKELLAKRNKIEAIKLYREAHKMGLKEAKDVIDQMDAVMRREGVSLNTSNMAIPSAPPISNDPLDDEAAGNRMRLMITIVVLLALGGAVAYFLLRGFGG
ncbi:MAG: ribosomal protein L7/L12 [Chloroflexota bacterium]